MIKQPLCIPANRILPVARQARSALVPRPASSQGAFAKSENQRGHKEDALLLGLAVLVVCAAGCSGFRAQPIDPANELLLLRMRAQAQLAVQRSSGAPAQPGAPEFDATDGLSEAELVGLALALNPGLLTDTIAIDEARAILSGSTLWPNPRFGLGLRPGIGGATGYTIDADFLFELLRPGMRGARKEIAASHLRKAQAERSASASELIASVRARHLKVLVAERILAQLEGAAALRSQTLALVRQRKDIGDATELEVSVAELELAAIESEARAAHAEAEGVRRALNLVVGVPPETTLALCESGKPLALGLFETPPDAELEMMVLAGRDDLKAKEAAYEQAEQELRLAYCLRIPSFGIGPSLSREPEADYYIGLGSEIEVPLFDRNQAEIAEKEAARMRAHADYSALLHQAVSEAHDARGRVERAQRDVQVLETQVLPIVERNAALFDAALRAREMHILEWVNAQERILHAKRLHFDAVVRYREALIAFEAATGSYRANGAVPAAAPPGD